MEWRALANVATLIRCADLLAPTQTLPDCPPLVFSLGTPAVERGFWLSSLALDSPEQVHLVLPVGGCPQRCGVPFCLAHTLALHSFCANKLV